MALKAKKLLKITYFTKKIILYTFKIESQNVKEYREEYRVQ